MTNFTELGLAEPLLRALADEGYDQPTPIQQKAIPVLMNGGDIVGIAQTGTGKTAAFVLPILNVIAGDRRRPDNKTCRSLIVAPTRELAVQIADNVRKYAAHMRISVTMVTGGVKAGPQIKGLARGVDVLVATPGRLLDHMSTGAVRLNACEMVVLDEADQMLDMGFIPAIRKIMAAMPKERQTALFSATMPKPIRALANDFLSGPKEISVAPAATPIERIEQTVLPVPSAEKRDALVRLIDEHDVERAIVFTRTKHGADRVARHLEQAGIETGAIHGNKNQSQRQRTLNAFKTGEIQVLVATDVAARGIDIPDVSHVINFELPNVPESYVHRIGRTARAGKEGVAISLCAPDERGLLRDIEKVTGLDFGLPGGERPQRRQNQKPRGRGGKPGGESGPRKHAGGPGGKPNRGQGEGRPGQPEAPPQPQWRQRPASAPGGVTTATVVSRA
ncbi:MAG: DEAD/DEAH box helicase [Minwuia sp.]|uniref:DEAD/DEAH box helicase n=1 Tax=Minwuia sp. TaxID=2493630 RepID=UPI003A864148